MKIYLEEIFGPILSCVRVANFTKALNLSILVNTVTVLLALPAMAILHVNLPVAYRLASMCQFRFRWLGMVLAAGESPSLVTCMPTARKAYAFILSKRASCSGGPRALLKAQSLLCPPQSKHPSF